MTTQVTWTDQTTAGDPWTTPHTTRGARRRARRRQRGRERATAIRAIRNLHRLGVVGGMSVAEMVRYRGGGR